MNFCGLGGEGERTRKMEVRRSILFIYLLELNWIE